MKQQELLPTPCHTWAEKLAAIHPDDLSIEDRAALDQHIQTCAACAAALADYRRMDAAILGLPPVEPLLALPPALQQAFGDLEESGELQQSYSSPPRPVRVQPRASRWVRLASAVAAVLVVTALIGGFAFLFISHRTLVGGAGAGQVIYIASRDSDGTVYAIRPSDGAVYWQYGIGQKLNGDLVASSDSVYASAGAHVYAMRKSDGSRRWTSPTIPGGAFSPMLADGNAVYLSSPDSLYALSQSDGHILWHLKQSSCPNGCAAVFMAVTNGTAFAYMDGLYALRARDGQILWHDPAYPFDSRSFAVTNGKVFAPDERKGLLYILSASNGQLLHTFPLLIKDEPVELLAAGGIVYIDNAGYNLYAIQASDDTVLWQKHSDTFILGLSAADNGGLYFSATTVSVGSIVPVTSSGSPIAGATPVVSSAASNDVYAVNNSDGSLRWHWQPSNNNGGASDMLAIGGDVYLTVGGSLYALSANDGHLLWVINIHATSLTSPVGG
ncbi:MAG TPA: PQQ-binding-like beta-propeller repeat protein [Ktedonobacteraceae bacterium]|nr:PQQ-binding-like beta-propeller repeat protein [Chthonomonadales bacterium]HEV2582703.1 PQQ-binding-like beta-propeller repeat protein [Ktedonobacteraceae bacterium]